MFWKSVKCLSGCGWWKYTKDRLTWELFIFVYSTNVYLLTIWWLPPIMPEVGNWSAAKSCLVIYNIIQGPCKIINFKTIDWILNLAWVAGQMGWFPGTLWPLSCHLSPLGYAQHCRVPSDGKNAVFSSRSQCQARWGPCVSGGGGGRLWSRGQGWVVKLPTSTKGAQTRWWWLVTHGVWWGFFSDQNLLARSIWKLLFVRASPGLVSTAWASKWWDAYGFVLKKKKKSNSFKHTCAEV